MAPPLLFYGVLGLPPAGQTLVFMQDLHKQLSSSQQERGVWGRGGLSAVLATPLTLFFLPCLPRPQAAGEW